MTTAMATAGRFRSGFTTLNTNGHKLGLQVFLVIVLAHWAEHITQAIQIWVLGEPVPQARGVLGEAFPWLVKSEALHYGYAIIMLVAFVALRGGFSGASRTWWNIALGIQVWHHFEHLLLLIQAHSGWHLAGKPVPTSIIQLMVPRVELHLAYNSIVFIPMVIAMILHRRPPATDKRRHARTCNCAPARV
ncbi:MAG TPA: hypothetical protein VE465_16545 [Streptosporangiaceae bacterium]|jgi:hypothetical protein|nr:hypothetical protein [Streptosporangiaceae bacterium]